MPRRIAMIAMHTSPLAAPGAGDAGGLNVYVRGLAGALAALDVEVDIFTRARAANSRPVVSLAEGVRVVTLPAGPLRPLPKEELPAHVGAFTCSILSFARQSGLDYDLVHGHYWLSGLVGLHLRERWDVPLVQMFHTLSRLKAAHGAEAAASPALACREHGEARVLAGADAIVTATSLERQALLAAYPVGTPAVHAIPCGVDTATFAPGDAGTARRRLRLQDTLPIFAAGRFDRLKGFDVLLRAVAMLLDDLPSRDRPLRVIVAGGPRVAARATAQASAGPHTGPDSGERAYRAELQRLAANLGLAGSVVLPGPLPRRALPLYYRAAAVCAVPSHYESFGLTALEALACGTPVVASRVGGLQLTVHDGMNGYLVAPGDPAALAARLGEVLAGDETRDRLSAAAARSAEPYAWATVAERMLCLYTSLGMGRRTALDRPRLLTGTAR